jgi:hypothetical protein
VGVGVGEGVPVGVGVGVPLGTINSKTHGSSGVGVAVGSS